LRNRGRSFDKGKGVGARGNAGYKISALIDNDKKRENPREKRESSRKSVDKQEKYREHTFRNVNGD